MEISICFVVFFFESFPKIPIILDGSMNIFGIEYHKTINPKYFAINGMCNTIFGPAFKNAEF